MKTETINWKSPDEALPDDEIHVLMQTDDDDIMIGYLFRESWYGFDHNGAFCLDEENVKVRYWGEVAGV